MKNIENYGSKYAGCLNNDEYPNSLEVHKNYRIITDEDADLDGDARIVDESGEDYLYPSEWFEVIDIPQKVVKVA